MCATDRGNYIRIYLFRTKTDFTHRRILTGINTGGIHIKRYVGTNAGTSQELGEENAWAGTVYVYMRNASTVGNISILIGSSSTSHILLAPGEWAFIPWRADDGDDIDVFQSLAASVGCLLEYGLYGA